MARISFDEKAELSEWRAALEALPSSIKNNEALFTPLMDFAIYSRDWTKARDLVRSSSNEELPFGERGPLIPRICLEIPIAKYQGEHPEMNVEFAAARNQLLRKVEGHPADPKLLSALSLIDAHMGRKQDALQEANCYRYRGPHPIPVGPFHRAVLEITQSANCGQTASRASGNARPGSR